MVRFFIMQVNNHLNCLDRNNHLFSLLFLINSLACDVQTDNNCNTIDGRVSVFMDGDFTDDTKSDTLQTIKNGMDGGDLLSAHESILKVTYISAVEESPNDDDGNPFTNDDNTTPIDNEVWTPGYVSGILIGSFVLFCSIIMARYAVRLPDEYDDQDVGTTQWREISSSSLGIVSYDDETIHASNKEIDVSLREDFDDEEYEDHELYKAVHEDVVYDKQNLLENKHDEDHVNQYQRHFDSYVDNDDDELNDDLNVNVDLESFDQKEKIEKDGCFDFFDLILENGGENRRRNNLLDTDDRSHLSELSF